MGFSQTAGPSRRADHGGAVASSPRFNRSRAGDRHRRQRSIRLAAQPAADAARTFRDVPSPSSNELAVEVLLAQAQRREGPGRPPRSRAASGAAAGCSSHRRCLPPIAPPVVAARRRAQQPLFVAERLRRCDVVVEDEESGRTRPQATKASAETSTRQAGPHRPSCPRTPACLGCPRTASGWHQGNRGNSAVIIPVRPLLVSGGLLVVSCGGIPRQLSLNCSGTSQDAARAELVEEHRLGEPRAADQSPASGAVSVASPRRARTQCARGRREQAKTRTRGYLAPARQRQAGSRPRRARCPSGLARGLGATSGRTPVIGMLVFDDGDQQVDRVIRWWPSSTWSSWCSAMQV